MFDGIKKKVKSIVGSAKRKVTKKGKSTKQRQAKPSEIKDINEDVDKDRGYYESKYIQEKKKNEEEKEKKARKVNMGKKLTQEQEQMRKEIYENSTSLKKLMNYIDKNKVICRSQDWKKNYGKLEDMLVLDDGRLAVVTERGGKVEPKITGQTMKDIFRNYKQLRTGVANGVVLLNLDEDGRFVENIMSREVPDMIIDNKGNIVTTKAHTKELQEHVAELKSQINELRGRWRTAEEAFVGENQDRKTLTEVKNLHKSRAEMAEGEYQQGLKKVEDILKEDRERVRVMEKIVNMKNIEEDMRDVLYGHRKEIQKKFGKLAEKSKEDLARDDFEDMAEWFKDQIMPEVRKSQEIQSSEESEE